MLCCREKNFAKLHKIEGVVLYAISPQPSTPANRGEVVILFSGAGCEWFLFFVGKRLEYDCDR